MLKYCVDRQNQRVDYLVDGWVSATEYKIAMLELKSYLEVEERQLVVLEEILSFKGMPPHLLLDDVWSRLKLISRFRKVAIVTDIRWIQLLTAFLSLFMPSKLRYFSIKEKVGASNWLNT